MRTFLRLPLALLIALGAITGVHAQSKDTRTVLPVWNKGSGKVEALLYLEPTGEQAAGARWHFGRNSLDAAFGLSSGDSLGLLCNSSSGTSISGLASHCMLASLGDEDDLNSRRFSGTAALNRGNSRLGITAGTGRETLPAWLAGPNKTPSLRAEQNDLTVFAQKNIGREGFVSIAGTYAKARLVPLADASPAIVDRWQTAELTRRGHIADSIAFIFYPWMYSLPWAEPWLWRLLAENRSQRRRQTPNKLRRGRRLAGNLRRRRHRDRRSRRPRRYLSRERRRRSAR